MTRKAPNPPPPAAMKPPAPPAPPAISDNLARYPLPERCPETAQFIGDRNAVGVATCEREAGHAGAHRGAVIAEWEGAS